MAHLDKQNFPENVRFYVDKTKTEILNSFSEVLESYDSIDADYTEALSKLEKNENELKKITSDNENLYRKYSHLSEDFNILAKNVKTDAYKVIIMYISICINILLVFAFLYTVYKS